MDAALKRFKKKKKKKKKTKSSRKKKILLLRREVFKLLQIYLNLIKTQKIKNAVSQSYQSDIQDPASYIWLSGCHKGQFYMFNNHIYMFLLARDLGRP